jgi:hypothetical protein
MAEPEGRGVATRVAAIRWKGPAPAARDHDDARSSISYMVKELAPWELRFDFIQYVDDERPGESEYQLAGFALERRITISEANTSPDSARMTSKHSATFLPGFPSYCRIAELRLRFLNKDADGRHAALSGPRPYRDLEFLVDEYRFREGTPSRIINMATDLGCHRTTIWRHLHDSVRQGLMSESELESRR